MKRLFLLLTLASALPLTALAQDDDLYFTPSKAPQTTNEAPAYYSGSKRSVDDYNRYGIRSMYQKIGRDSLGNSMVRFRPGYGVLPDTTYVDTAYIGRALGDNDYTYTRRMSRWDGFYDPWFYGYYGPWRWGYAGYYSPWYYYNGWYDPWYYDYAGWYDPVVLWLRRLVQSVLLRLVWPLRMALLRGGLCKLFRRQSAWGHRLSDLDPRWPQHCVFGWPIRWLCRFGQHDTDEHLHLGQQSKPLVRRSHDRYSHRADIQQQQLWQQYAVYTIIRKQQQKHG